MDLRIGFLLEAESRGLAALHWLRRLILPMAALPLIAAMPVGGPVQQRLLYRSHSRPF